MNKDDQNNNEKGEKTLSMKSPTPMSKSEKPKETKVGPSSKSRVGFIATLIGLGLVTLILVIITISIRPIMSPKAEIEATAISITKTFVHDTGAYVDPDLMIEPLPVENVSGIVMLGGLMALIVIAIVLREFILWRKKGGRDESKPKAGTG